jgi:hypothetical protein
MIIIQLFFDCEFFAYFRYSNYHGENHVDAINRHLYFTSRGSCDEIGFYRQDPDRVLGSSSLL